MSETPETQNHPYRELWRTAISECPETVPPTKLSSFFGQVGAFAEQPFRPEATTCAVENTPLFLAMNRILQMAEQANLRITEIEEHRSARKHYTLFTAAESCTDETTETEE